jgi:hypothetical protein
MDRGQFVLGPGEQLAGGDVNVEQPVRRELEELGEHLPQGDRIAGRGPHRKLGVPHVLNGR